MVLSRSTKLASLPVAICSSQNRKILIQVQSHLLLGIIAEHDLDLHSFDVKTAFLYTRLNEFSESIYMRRPEGFSDTEMPAIVRLLRVPYGLDIASKLFEEHFSNTLTTMGFKRLISDPQVFRLDFCLLSTFVDDALAAASPGSPKKNWN